MTNRKCDISTVVGAISKLRHAQIGISNIGGAVIDVVWDDLDEVVNDLEGACNITDKDKRRYE